MPGERAMSELIAVTFADQARAAQVLDTLRRLQVEKLIELDDVCIVTRDANGRIDLHQALNTPPPSSKKTDVWATLLGALFLVPLVGLVVAVATGGLRGGLAVFGVADDFIGALAGHLRPGSSALFLLARRRTSDRLIAELRPHGGHVTRTSVSKDAQRRLGTTMRAGAPAVVS
jgi:uncharacterized membrane protein